MCRQGAACNKELWAETKNQFQSLEDQVEVVMVIEGDGTADSLEKQLLCQERKQLQTVLENEEISG